MPYSLLPWLFVLMVSGGFHPPTIFGINVSEVFPLLKKMFEQK